MNDAKHIMIADDDEEDIELLMSALKECPEKINVSAARNGLALLEILEQGCVPDLIVLDLNMPYMNGYKCLGAIRRNQKYNQVPVMILSTSLLKSDIDFCLSSGANYYAVKPSNLADLKNLVKVMCKGIMANSTVGQA